MTSKIILCCLFLCFSCAPGMHKNKAKDHPTATGTFIQRSLLMRWDDSQCNEEFQLLKKAGIKYIVFAPAVSGQRNGTYHSIYQSSIENVRHGMRKDLLEMCLSNAEKVGLKVFIGLNFSEGWWRKFDAEWLFGEMEMGNSIADEIMHKYKDKYKDVLYGWYWVWEIDNLRFNTEERKDMLAQALNINLDHLNQISPDMPVMLCPFMNSRVGNAVDYGEFWKYIFSKTHFKSGDIFAPQDCIGAGGLQLDALDYWFHNLAEAVKSKPGLLFWSDAETFDQQFWTSAPLDRFVKQMDIVKPYVSNIITFAFSHYYSPNVTRDGFYEAYLYYVKNGSLPEPEPVSSPSDFIVTVNALDHPVLTWSNPTDMKNICGYYIYRDEKLISNIQPKTMKFPQMLTDTGGYYKKGMVYEIRPYGFSGYTYNGLKAISK